MKQRDTLKNLVLNSQPQQNVISPALFKGDGKPAAIDFKSNGVLTLGVEIELQLIEAEKFNLAPCAQKLLKFSRHLKKIKPEFYLSTIEVNTDKCNTVQEVEKDLRQTISKLNLIAKKQGIAFSTTGAHPFAKYTDCIISPTARYQEMIDRNQWLTRRMTVYGLHVHLGMASGDDCIRYNKFFMNFLPHLLALSASSPFWQGMDTGLSSCRPTTYEALPTAGQPYPVNSWREFEVLYAALKKCDAIKTLKDLWWDIRPSPDYGTLEIRVCDGCATLYEALAVASFIHALAHWAADHSAGLDSAKHPPAWLMRENKWRVIRYGLDAELVMNAEGKTKPLKDDLKKWIERLKPYAKKLGYKRYFTNLLTLMDCGTSSVRQRAVFQETQSLIEVVKFNIREFLLQKPDWAQSKKEIMDSCA